MQPINTTSATISATTTSARAAYPLPRDGSGVRVHNAGTVAVFLQSGDSSVAATTGGQFLGPNQTGVFAKNPQDTHLAAITASGTASIYFANCGP